MKKNMRRFCQAVLTAGAVLMLSLVSMSANAANSEDMTEEVRAFAQMYRISEDEIISEGVRIGGVDIGGLTLMEAVDALIAGQQEMLNRTVTLSLEGSEVSYTMEQLGLGFINPSEEVVRAASLGKSGRLIERYKANRDIAYHGYDVPMSRTIDQNRIKEVVASFARAANQNPLEATVKLVNNQFEVTHEQTGIAVDETATLDQVLTAVETWDGTSSLRMEVQAMITEPKYTYEALSTISDCLGSFKTICGDLDTNRGVNVMVGAAKIDGAVLLPGESYSVVDVLAPFTADNGYMTAVQYLNGRYDDSVGGGVCSLSTTLYNAVLRAELQVEKRWNHSMVVSYTDWGFDSTINDYGTRDLVFTNNYDTPIYIETYTVYGKPDSWLYFNIYGKETRDTVNRKLKFYNNVLECVYPTKEERTYILDEKLPPGTEEWDQSDYPYVVAEAYKEVWVNGKLESKELLHKDTYVKSAAIIRYNPAEPEPEPEPEPVVPETEASSGTLTQETAAPGAASPDAATGASGT